MATQTNPPRVLIVALIVQVVLVVGSASAVFWRLRAIDAAVQNERRVQRAQESAFRMAIRLDEQAAVVAQPGDARPGLRTDFLARTADFRADREAYALAADSDARRGLAAEIGKLHDEYVALGLQLIETAANPEALDRRERSAPLLRFRELQQKIAGDIRAETERLTRSDTTLVQQELRAQLDAAVGTIRFTGGLLLAGIILGPLLLIRHTRLGLERFARAADAVEGDDLAYRITWDGPAEFRPVVARFNSMLERLEATTMTKRRLEHGDAAVSADTKTRDSDIVVRAEMVKVVENAARAWRRTFDAVDFVLLTVDRSGNVQRVNRSALTFLGGRFDDWIGRPLSEFPAHQPWLEANRLVTEAIAAGGTPQRAQVDEDRVWELACTGFGPDDEFSVLWARDVTKMVELQRAVLRSEAMGAMGELLAGVAHEVRNPLFAITALLDAWSLQPGVQQVPFLRMLRQEVMRMRQLMEELLEYGRPFNSQLVVADLKEVAGEAVNILGPALKARDLKMELDVSGLVKMDRARMLRVFLNLLQNAIDHSDPGATIRVESCVRPDDQPRALDISFRDHGQGFMAADLPKVFHPFFTRRPGGTGLGLPIVQRIVEEHGGTVTAGNHPEGGALIHVELPLAAEADAVTV